MNEREILQKAIEKAEKNGFKYGYDWKGRDEAIFWLNAWHSLIFDHDFAKAFWGECSDKVNCLEPKRCCFYPDSGLCSNQYWQYHLQQMVLEKEPLKYLEKFL